MASPRPISYRQPQTPHSTAQRSACPPSSDGTATQVNLHTAPNTGPSAASENHPSSSSSSSNSAAQCSPSEQARARTSPQPLAARSNRAVQSPAGPCTMRVDEGIARPPAASASGLGGGRRARSRATTREEGITCGARRSKYGTVLEAAVRCTQAGLGSFSHGGTHQSKPEITESWTTKTPCRCTYIPTYAYNPIQSNPVQSNPTQQQQQQQQPQNHKHVYLPSSYLTPLCLSRSPPTPRGTQRNACAAASAPCPASDPTAAAATGRPRTRRRADGGQTDSNVRAM